MPVYKYRIGSYEKVFVFVHIPKTGGTAVENYFRVIGLSSFFDPPSYMPIRQALRIPPAHYDYRVLDGLFRLENFYSFAVVRHPLDRMISEYKWASTRSTLSDQLKGYSFSQFLDFGLKRYKRDENFLAGHMKPQSRFVGGKIARVFKYEAGLNNIIKEVLGDVGIKLNEPVMIPHVNKSADISAIVTEEDHRLVRELYEEDFEQFGYK